MAQAITGFYSTKNFIHVRHAINLALITHFSNMLFDGDTSRIIYSTNAYAFRTRSNQNDGNLSLPFWVPVASSLAVAMSRGNPLISIFCIASRKASGLSRDGSSSRL